MIRQSLTILALFAPTSNAFAQADVDALLNKLQNPGVQVYSCNSKQKGCSEMYNSFCKKLYSKDHLGNMDIASGSESFKIRLGKDKNSFSHSFLEYEKAKLDAIRNKRIPEDFLKNLNPQYVSKLETYLKSKPADQMSDQEKQEMSEQSNELSFLFNSAWGKTVAQRVTRKFPGFYSNKSSDYGLSENIEAGKIDDQFTAEFYRSIWDKNEKFLKAKKDFNETKAAYLKYLEETDDLSAEDKAKFKSWISTVTLDEPGSDSSNTDPECLGTQKNAYYQPAFHKIKICAGYFNGVENNQRVFAHELSHALGLSRARIMRQRESELGRKTKEWITSVCSEKERGKCPAEWNSYKSNFETMVKGQGTMEPPLKAYRQCLMLDPEKLRPILNENKSENAVYSSFVSSKAEEYAAYEIDSYATQNRFTSWIAENLPQDADTGKIKKNPRRFNPCADISYFNDQTYSVGGSTFDRAVVISEYLCSKAPTDAKKMKAAVDTLTSLESTYYQDGIRFGGSLSDWTSVKNKHFAEDTEERFADAMGNRVFAKMVEQRYPTNVSDWQAKRRNFFLSATPTFCEKPNWANEHLELAKVEKSYSSEPHSNNEQRRLDVVNSPMREVLGCTKDNDNKECKP